jgi:hypothetical protein
MKTTPFPMLVISVVVAVSLAPASAQKPATRHVALTPADVTWGDPPPWLNPGAKLAVMSGNPSEPGLVTLRLQMPAGYKIAPHWHPNDEHVTVLSGVFAVGMGDTFDQANMKELPTGSYGVVPEEMRHFAMAKGAAVIQVQGMGPFVIRYVNPADDPSRAQKH